MKALSMTWPWGLLVATGDKTLETRSWPCHHHGPLAIHLAKAVPDWVREWVDDTRAVQTMLLRAGYSLDPNDAPLGCVVATCQMAGCVATERVDWLRTPSKERIVGDYTPGRFAFILRDVARVNPPVPARGSLSLWEFDEAAAGLEVMVTGRLF
jgi:hypothetical protein